MAAACLSCGDLHCSKKSGNEAVASVLDLSKHSRTARVSEKWATAAPKIFVNPLSELPTSSAQINRTLAGIPRSTFGTRPTTCCPPADEMSDDRREA
jgi:hypothetical protein